MPLSLGKQLHKTHRPRTDWGLLSVITALIGIVFGTVLMKGVR